MEANRSSCLKPRRPEWSKNIAPDAASRRRSRTWLGDRAVRSLQYLPGKNLWPSFSQAEISFKKKSKKKMFHVSYRKSRPQPQIDSSDPFLIQKIPDFSIPEIPISPVGVVNVFRADTSQVVPKQVWATRVTNPPNHPYGENPRLLFALTPFYSQASSDILSRLRWDMITFQPINDWSKTYPITLDNIPSYELDPNFWTNVHLTPIRNNSRFRSYTIPGHPNLIVHQETGMSSDKIDFGQRVGLTIQTLDSR